MSEVTLGCKARDKVTGFEGIVTGKCDYLYGCAQWGLTPAAKDGEVKDSRWFDEGRVERVGDGIAPESVRVERNGPGDSPRKAHGRM
jgi:hypothetical protein